MNLDTDIIEFMIGFLSCFGGIELLFYSLTTAFTIAATLGMNT